MYLSEMEYRSENRGQMEVHQEEYSCPGGVQKTPCEVHQRPVWSTSVWAVQENVAKEDGGCWCSSIRDPAVVQVRIA
jgi:hypothetical protein